MTINTYEIRKWVVRAFVATIAVFWLIALVATAASSQTTIEIDIDFETIYRGDPGDLILVGEAPAPIGEECAAELEFGNNEAQSMHPGSDILVGPTGFLDVENGTFEAAGLTFISDGTNLVYVRIGVDGVFSGGLILEVTCNPSEPAPTTTTEPPVTTSSTTTIATPAPSTTTTINGVTTSVPSATTTTETPVGGIDTGGGACADWACTGSLSPPLTWTGIAAVWAAISGLAWAAIAYSKKGTYE